MKTSTLNQKIEYVYLNLFNGLDLDKNESALIFWHNQIENNTEKGMENFFQKICNEIDNCKENVYNQTSLSFDYFQLEKRLRYLKVLVMEYLEQKYKIEVSTNEKGKLVFRKNTYSAEV